MGAIYRKYRPQRFSEVIGHEAVVSLLRNEITSNTPAHAYLFSGVRGVGKTTFARLLAKALNCLNREKIDKRKKGKGISPGDPCGNCDSCISIEKTVFTDVLEIDAASHRGIDEIRSLKERVAFAPMRGRYKVYIIDEAHMLTREAFNALLKTLEEPPAFVVFILCTTEPHKLPETIISRCQWFELKLATPEQLIEKLKEIARAEKIKVDTEVFELVSRVANGSFRDGESLFGSLISAIERGKSITVKDARKILNMPNKLAIANLFGAIIKGNATAAKSRLEKLRKRGFSADKILDGLIEEGSGRLFSDENLEFLSEITKIQHRLIEAKKMCGYLPDPFIALELVIVESMKKDGTKDENGQDPCTEKVVKRKTRTFMKNKNISAGEKERTKQQNITRAQDEKDWMGNWNKAVLALEKSNCQLVTILLSCVVYLSGNTLRVVARNGFELGVISSPKNQEILRKEVCNAMECVDDIIFEKNENITEKTVENVDESDLGSIFT